MGFQCVITLVTPLPPPKKKKQKGRTLSVAHAWAETKWPVNYNQFFSLCSLIPYAYAQNSYFIYLPNIPCKISSSQGNNLIISHEGNGMWRKNASLHLSFSSSTTCKNTRFFQRTARQQSSVYFSLFNSFITSVMTLLKIRKYNFHVYLTEFRAVL